jgi:hypothetical protein
MDVAASGHPVTERPNLGDGRAGIRVAFARLDLLEVEFEADTRTERHRECALLRIWSVLEEGMEAARIVRHLDRLGKVHHDPLRKQKKPSSSSARPTRIAPPTE